MTTINNYRIYCDTENAWVEGYGTTSPTVCYNNNTHTVNGNSVQLLKSISETEVTINEGVLTQTGKFVATCLSLDCPGPAGTETTASISWKYNISALNFSFDTEEIQRGDVITLVIGENTTVGTLASNIAPATAYTSQNYTEGSVVTYNGETYTCILNTVSNEIPLNATYWTDGFRLHVDPSVITYVNHGCKIKLTNIPYGGSNSDNVGEVISIDKLNNYIYVDNANILANSYSSTSPDTLVQLTLCMLENYEIGGPVYRKFAGEKIGGAFIPKKTVVTIKYKNVDGVAGKRFIGTVEFLRGENS